jgi:hypothetical protein
MEANLRERREEQVRARQAPDDMSFRPSGYSRCKQRCSRAIDGTGSATGEFVQRAISETASGENGVHLGHSERQAASHLRAVALDRGDALAQISKDSIANSRHRARESFRFALIKVTASCRLN